MPSGRQPGQGPTDGPDVSDASEPAPAEAVEGAKAAFGQRAAGELAVLVHDSLIDEGDTPQNHLLQFEHASLRIDVRVSAVATARISGTVQPPVPLEVGLEVEGADAGPHVDAPDGNFSFERVPHGVVRLHLTGPAGTTPVHTDWFRV